MFLAPVSARTPAWHIGRTARNLAAVLLLASTAAWAQQTTAADRAAQAFTRAAQQGPLALHAFLWNMPKGADLHVHLAGAVYAETMLDEAAADGTCVDVHTLSFDRTAMPGHCKPGEVSGPAALERDATLRNALIDSFSMRGFVPAEGFTGHDQFFSTFGRFGSLGHTHAGDWLDAVARRAAMQNEQYVEIMDTPDIKGVEALAEKTGYNPDFRAYRTALLAAGFDASVPEAEATFRAAEQRRAALEHCDTSQPANACGVKIRFLFQVLREQPPVDVFAQVLFAFELAKADPADVVGLNFVQPEDGYLSMHDYRLQMSMLDALHGLYPGVHITLHAGELAPGLVPPEGLTFHIRDAIDVGHAERIGHGVDVMYEDHPYQLLHEMAEQHILVEVNLTSNAVILGIAGRDHPLPFYLHAGVPVALSTDDAGVSRIDLTHEYVTAADTFHLSYAELKEMARASLEHSFLPGASLWRRVTPEQLTHPVAPCAGQLGQQLPTGGCAALVRTSEKAREQWDLERRFTLFENQF